MISGAFDRLYGETAAQPVLFVKGMPPTAASIFEFDVVAHDIQNPHLVS
jgi:hypothetical protein